MIDGWLYSEEEMVARNQAGEARQRQRFSAALLVDPRPEALIALTRTSQHRELRGLYYTGVWYWWDAFLATHFEAARFLDCASRPLINELEAFASKDGKRVWIEAKTCFGLSRFVDHPLYAGHTNAEGYLTAERQTDEKVGNGVEDDTGTKPELPDRGHGVGD